MTLYGVIRAQEHANARRRLFHEFLRVKVILSHRDVKHPAPNDSTGLKRRLHVTKFCLIFSPTNTKVSLNIELNFVKIS